MLRVSQVEEKPVPKRLLHIIFSVLTLSSAALFGAAAQAGGSWKPLEIIDMRTVGNLSADIVVTTGFFDDVDLVSLDDPAISFAADGIKIDTDTSKKSGWSGLVEVEVTEEPTLPFDDFSAYTDVYAQADDETKLQGFYTMRYQFNSGARFRPYAGAGLGLVATTTDAETAGVIAGRATAGFDLTLGEGSALFAEYAIMKNGGVNLGNAGGADNASDGVLDIEHTVKLGFRRSF